ncbi:zeta toxin family protein [Streptomyces sp. NPDC050997]|uniref:zeta toxin family protein n=1 Tax=Streptomyces sp. NPDC050997 TaxID=3155519 RepID=UPI00342661A9
MAEIFEDIKGTYLSDVASTGDPVVVYVMSQPGGGKSESLYRWPPLLPGRRPVRIVGDDYKGFHPAYLTLLEGDPRNAGSAIRPYYGAWQAWAEDFVRQRRGDAVIEIAPGSAKQFREGAAAFREAGYRVELIVLAVRPSDSRLGTATRYAEAIGAGASPARFTSASGHDDCFAAVEASVLTAEQEAVVDRVTVRRRDGTELYQADRGTPEFTGLGALDVVRAEWSRSYTDPEAARFRDTLARLREMLPGHGAELDEIAELARPLLPSA